MSVHDHDDDTTGYGQVCCPPPTHGQTKRKELESSLRMVSTAIYDQRNLPTDQLCDVVQEAQANAQIHVPGPLALKAHPLAQKAHPLTQDVAQPDDAHEGRHEVALRVNTRHGSIASTLARPKDPAPIDGMSY